ncbi:MAG: folate-binding protein [Pseudomonadota bacterium]
MSMSLTGWLRPGRAVLRMEGGDGRQVLQDVVTNSVDPLAPGRAVYAALLTPQGKYLFDFFLVDPGDGSVLIDAAEDRAEALMRRLSMYCLRRDARLNPEPSLSAALAWPGEAGARPPTPPASPGQASSEGPGDEEGMPVGALAVPDPRLPALGLRLYAADPAAALASVGAEVLEHDAAAAAWTRLRVRHAVPAGGVELVPEESFVLEFGLDRLNGVDFRKGCYVGQEVTARMHHRATLKKGLLQVRVEGEAAPGTPVATADGKPAGTLFSQAGGEGLAHLRYDRLAGPLTAGSASIAAEPPVFDQG